MRKLLYIFPLIVFSLSAYCQPGLLGSYPFNGNANDISGNGNHGVLNNAVLTADHFGNPNSAYFFNGINSFINLGNNFAYSSHSFLCWARRDSIVGGRIPGNMLVSKINNGPYNFQNSEFSVDVFTIGTGNTWEGVVDTITPIDYTGWNCYVATYDAVTNTARLYVNGVVSSVVVTNYSDVANTPVYIGARPFWGGAGATTFFFQGAIDEVKIFNRALTQQEIDSLCAMAGASITPSNPVICSSDSVTLTASGGDSYQWSTGATADSIVVTAAGTYTVTVSDISGFSVTLSETVTVQTQPNVVASLIGYYPFNGNEQDASGSNYHGINNGATLTTDRFGNANSAYSFNGTSNYIDVNDAVPLRLNNTDYTISFWTYINAYTTAGTAFVYKRGFTNGSGWAVGTNPGAQERIALIVSEGTDPRGYTTSALPTGSWHHVVVAYSLSAEQLTFYIDGVLNNSTTGVDNNFNPTNGIPTPSPSNSSVMRFGQDSKNAAYWLNGKLDDIRIYKRALSPCDIDSLFNEPACTLSSVNLIGMSGATTFCNGDSVTLTALQGTTYLWSTGAASASVVALASGTYTVTASSGLGCSATASQTVTVRPVPVAPTVTTGGSTAICAEQSVTLTSSAQSGNLWSNGATSNSITVDSSGIFTVSTTDTNGCASAASAAVVVTVNPVPVAPVITASGATTFCEGGSVTLTSSQPSGNVWSNGATTNAITIDSSETFTVTYTDVHGCTSDPSIPVAVVVTAGQLSVSVSTQGTNLCAGDTDGAVKVNVTGGTLPYDYEWSHGATTSTITDLAAGSYTVTVTDSNGCSASFTETINDGALVIAGNIAGADTADIATPESYSVFAGYSYTWTVTNGTIVSGQGTNTIVVDWTAIPQGTIQVIASEQGCTDTVSKTVWLIDATGIEDAVLNGIELYPNPTNGTITIKAATSVLPYVPTLRLFDSVGKEVFQQTATSIELQQGILLDLRDATEGIYFLSIKTEAGMRVMKVVKY